MTNLSLFLIFSSTLFYSQNKCIQHEGKKQLLTIKPTVQERSKIKHKVDSVNYKMLVKKVVMPELYLIMVVKPSEAMIEIPNIQFLADKQYSICEKNITINQAVFPPHKVD